MDGLIIAACALVVVAYAFVGFKGRGRLQCPKCGCRFSRPVWQDALDIHGRGHATCPNCTWEFRPGWFRHLS